jgi:hypothetical protein
LCFRPGPVASSAGAFLLLRQGRLENDQLAFLADAGRLAGLFPAVVVQAARLLSRGIFVSHDSNQSRTADFL